MSHSKHLCKSCYVSCVFCFKQHHLHMLLKHIILLALLYLRKKNFFCTRKKSSCFLLLSHQDVLKCAQTKQNIFLFTYIFCRSNSRKIATRKSLVSTEQCLCMGSVLRCHRISGPILLRSGFIKIMMYKKICKSRVIRITTAFSYYCRQF